jgi:glycosyltransferase involved in cell wall biosynthesis
VKVALVHDWLTGYRGGERVLAALCALYPQADLFTLVHVPGSCGPVIESRKISTSFLQSLPRAQTHYRHYLPLFPAAIERLDLRGYELVISTSHAVAKGCKPAPGAVHLSYVHTPMRYVWDQFDAYFGPGRASLPVRLAARAVAPTLRRWDVESTKRVDGIIANSRFVSERCKRVWGRAADAVVYPPVETGLFQPAAGLTGKERGERGYALILSALVPYKRIDLAVRAFNRAGRRLVVAGGGPELARLRALAGPTVEVRGVVALDELQKLYAHAAFFVLPGEEDFGIAPVEAQAAGRPVLALGKGGALETVRAGSEPTGVFFAEPSEESLLEALPEIDRVAREVDPAAIREWALRFDAARFGPELAGAIERLRAAKAGARSANSW